MKGSKWPVPRTTVSAFIYKIHLLRKTMILLCARFMKPFAYIQRHTAASVLQSVLQDFCCMAVKAASPLCKFWGCTDFNLKLQDARPYLLRLSLHCRARRKTDSARHLFHRLGQQTEDSNWEVLKLETDHANNTQRNNRIGIFLFNSISLQVLQ